MNANGNPISWCSGRLALGVFLVPVLFSGGCGSSDSMPKTYPATGKVAYTGGRTFSGGTIQFASPTDTSLTVTGAIDDQGKFSLNTIKGTKKVSGAPEGEYKVTILALVANDQRPVPPVVLSQTYHVEAKDNDFSFEVSPVTSPPR